MNGVTGVQSFVSEAGIISCNHINSIINTFCSLRAFTAALVAPTTVISIYRRSIFSLQSNE